MEAKRIENQRDINSLNSKNIPGLVGLQINTLRVNTIYLSKFKH